ncbi:MAG: hypothetical protein EP343_22705 [Deltaproteobacteria bacterium]|nr:MAG: hypothetical protein EP343_22705 [Deltaproteobacteria bacterium]
MKPIAIDIGKAFWVIARTDENQQPTVAGLGDGGLIPSIITEQQGQLMVGEPVEPVEGVPYLRDCYQWIMGDAETRAELGDYIRNGANGEMEFFFMSQWWPASSLLARMLGSTTQVVKDYLSPQAALPAVAAVPPGADPHILQTLHHAMQEAGLALSGWCPTPLALAYGDSELVHREHAIAATLIVDWGFLSLGVVEVRNGFPLLRVSQNLEWSWKQWGQQLPLEQVAALVDQVMGMAQNFWNIQSGDIERLLIGGEEAWIHQLYPVLQERIPAVFSPFHQPRLAVAMGTAVFADTLVDGISLAPLESPTPSTQVSLTGFAIPGAQVEVRGGAQDEAFVVELSGSVDHPVTLVSDQVNTLTLSVLAPDGRQFTTTMEVEHQTEDLGQPSDAVASAPPANESISEWSRSYIELEPGEASLIGLKMDEEIKMEEEPDVGESTDPDLGVPDKDKDAPAAEGELVGADFGELPPAELLVSEDGSFASIGEGDGETRILTQDSYAHLLAKEKANKEKAANISAASKEEEAMDIDDSDILESVEALGSEDDGIIKSVPLSQTSLSPIAPPPSSSLAQDDLDDAEIDEAIDFLEQEEPGSASLSVVVEDEEEAVVAHLGSLDDLPESEGLVNDEAPIAIDDVDVLEVQDVSEEVVLQDSEPEAVEESPSPLSGFAPPPPMAEEPELSTSSSLDAVRDDKTNDALETPTAEEPVEEPLEEEVVEEVLAVEAEAVQNVVESVVKEVEEEEEDVPAPPPSLPSKPALPPLAPRPVVTASSVDSSGLSREELIQLKLEQARQLAREARELVEESQAAAEDAALLTGPLLFSMFWDAKEAGLENKPMELSVRREARKILELGKQLAEVEANRLPTSSRKTLSRLTNELDEQLQNDDGRIPVRLAFQLANRLFEIIRRDLRPW